MKQQFTFKDYTFEVYSNDKIYGANKVQYFSIKQVGSYDKPAAGQWSHVQNSWIALPGGSDFNQAIAIAAGLIEAPKVEEVKVASSPAREANEPKYYALPYEQEAAQDLREEEEREYEEILDEHFQKNVLIWENSKGQEIRVEYFAANHSQSFYEVRVGNAPKERYSAITTKIPAKLQAVAQQHGIVAMLGNVGLTAERRDALLAMAQ